MMGMWQQYFAATTNRVDNIDQADLRRFTLKVKFEVLTKGWIDLAYRHFFDCEPTQDVLRLQNLSPR